MRKALIPRATIPSARYPSGAYKLGTMIKVSEELLNDSVFDLESYIAREFARRIGTKEEEAFFTGDGTRKAAGNPCCLWWCGNRCDGGIRPLR